MYLASALVMYMNVYSYHACSRSISLLIVHAYIALSVSNMYLASALLMYMHVHSYHECSNYLNACPPIVHAYIATSPLIVHACMSISEQYVRALLMYMNVFSYHACLR